MLLALCRRMRRRLKTTKILVATIGVGVVSHIAACGGSTSSTDNGTKDAASDVLSTSGNLMAPLNDSGSQDVVAPEAGFEDVVTSGNLMAVEAGTPDAEGDAGGDGG
jgi:hypothetical protein